MNEVQFNLRMTKELKEGLEVLAKAQNRSMNNLIVMVLEDYAAGISERVRAVVEGVRNLSDEEIKRIINKTASNTRKEKEDGR